MLVIVLWFCGTDRTAMKDALCIIIYTFKNYFICLPTFLEWIMVQCMWKCKEFLYNLIWFHSEQHIWVVWMSFTLWCFICKKKMNIVFWFFPSILYHYLYIESVKHVIYLIWTFTSYMCKFSEMVKK